MLAVVGILGVLSGAVLACTSARFPAHVRAIEIGAGGLRLRAGKLRLADHAVINPPSATATI